MTVRLHFRDGPQHAVPAVRRTVAGSARGLPGHPRDPGNAEAAGTADRAAAREQAEYAELRRINAANRAHYARLSGKP